MILGTNIVHAAHWWSSMRPWREEALQIEPPWSGDWDNPVCADELIPGIVYRCRVSSGGSASGRKNFEAVCDSLESIVFRGSVIANPGRPGLWVIDIGSDNVWIEIRVTRRTLLRDIRLSMTDVEAQRTALPTDPWSEDFLVAAKPFPIWRMMDFCGIGSRVTTAALAEEHGSFAQRPLRHGDVEPAFGRFNAETGVSPALWFPPNAKEVWINCPLLIALDPTERARWLVEAWLQSEAAARRFGHDAPKLVVEVDNEMENNAFTMARLAYHYAQAAHWNQAVARTVAILRVAREMKRTIEQLGFSKRMRVVFATLPGNRWPFSFDPWLNAHVAPEARELLQEVGKFATTFYWGGQALTADDVMPSVEEEGRNLAAWKSTMDELRVELDIYESGPHFRREALPALRRAPETIEAAKRSIEVLEATLREDARVFWYGFCERQQWGLLPDLRPESRSDPLYTAVAKAAEARFYRAQ